MRKTKAFVRGLICLLLAVLLNFTSAYSPIVVETKASGVMKASNDTGEKKYTRFIIKYKNEKHDKEVLSQLKDKVKSSKKIKSKGLDIITSKENLNPKDLISELKLKKIDSLIEYIQPDYKLTLSSNDPYFSSQWGLGSTVSGEVYSGSTNIESAWEESQGEGVTIGIIDTAIDIDHEDLKENIWVNTGEIPGNGIDDDGNNYVDDTTGWNFSEDNNVVNTGDMDHGTHVAGIIAAVKDNGKGTAGVAPKAKVMPLKVFNNGQAYTSDIVEAIEYAEKMGVKVINGSWGSSDENQALKEAIEGSSMLFVCAAGNSGINIDESPVYPASYASDNVIAVASVNTNGNLSGTSNYGLTSVDVAAPGEHITSTLPGNKYGEKSGTSMSAGFVSGEAALILKNNEIVSIQELRRQILNSRDSLVPNIKEIGGLYSNGIGIVNDNEGSVLNSVYDSVYGSAYKSAIEVNLFSESGIYQASKDFSSVQGQNGWYYVEKIGNEYKNMAWDTTDNCWKGSYTYNLITRDFFHPDVNDSVRKWVAPYSGNVLITSNGNVRKQNTSGGDGVNVRLYKNSSMLWESYVTGTDGVGVSFPPRIIEVIAGDEIYFELNRNGNNYCDATMWDPIIEYKGPYTYQASKDFSSVQGNNGWYYVEKIGNEYKNMAWDTTDNCWKGSYTYNLITRDFFHPDVNDSARKWIAPYSGNVLITSNGNVRKQNTSGGDGVNVRLYKNSSMLWESYVTGTDGVGVSFPPRIIEVIAGDEIYFELNRNGNNYCDATMWDPIIEYKGPYTYQASKDFSSVQGNNGWYYVEKIGNEYKNMAWDTTDNCWKGSYTYNLITRDFFHPDVNDSARKWIAPYSGNVLITSNGNVRKQNTSGGDGVNVRLYKNSSMLWESYVTGTDGVGVSFPPRIIEVIAGDEIYFELNRNGNNYCDATMWDPIIEYKGPYTYQASKDFSSVQGNNGWYYVEKIGNEYKNMAWDTTDNCWKGSYTYNLITRDFFHPDVNDSVRKWVAPYSGNILVTSNENIRKGNTGGGDGVNVRLYKNSSMLWESYIAGTDGVGVKFPPTIIEVVAGDEIYFELNKNAGIDFDATIWDPIIEYKTHITYEYNSNNQLLEVRKMGTPFVKYEYDANGRLIRRLKN